MKHFSLFVFSIIFLNQLNSQSFTIEWSKHLAGTSADEKIVNIAEDGDGNIYGITDGYGNQTFDGTTYTATGTTTTIFKTNTAGVNSWVYNAWSSESGSIAVDGSANCYFGGWFIPPSITFAPFTINAPPGTIGSASYLTSVNSAGNFSSAAMIAGGNTFLNSINRIISDEDGNLAYIDNREYFTGVSYTQYHTLTKVNIGGATWTIPFNSTDVTPLWIDNANNLYIFGTYTTDIVINGTTLTNSGGVDVYLAKINSSGIYQWAKKIGGNKYDIISSFTSDPEGNLYLTGYFTSDSLDIDGHMLYSDGLHHNSFAIKLNSAGTCIWANSIESVATNTSFGIVLDPETSTLTMAGTFVNGDITVGPDVLINTPLIDYYTAQIDLSGNFLGANTISLPVGPTIYKNKLLSPNSLAVAGAFSGTFIIGDQTLVSAGSFDGFITYITVSACEDEVTVYADSDGDGFGNILVSITTCEIPAGYVLNNGDCNDANNNINPDESEICNSLDDDCDATIDDNVITAAITPSGPTTFCKGGSVILNANAGAGFTYQWKKNGVNVGGGTGPSLTVTKAGTYTVLVTIPGGCIDLSDGVIVVVNTTPAATISNLDITNDLCMDGSIKLKASSGPSYTYQWYKGATPLAGSTSQIYYATSTGNYKVLVTSAAGCTKMSAVFTIIDLCREAAFNSGELMIYPNPNRGIFTLSFTTDATQNNAIISIVNITGEEVYTTFEEIHNGELLITVEPAVQLSSGIYFVTIITGANEFVRKLIIE